MTRTARWRYGAPSARDAGSRQAACLIAACSAFSTLSTSWANVAAIQGRPERADFDLSKRWR